MMRPNLIENSQLLPVMSDKIGGFNWKTSWRGHTRNWWAIRSLDTVRQKQCN